MKQLSKSFTMSLVLALISLPLLHAQNATTAPADANTTSATQAPPAQAPEDVTNKITALVHAGKYAEAQQLTTSLLIAYPDDQRLIKAKALLDKLLAPGGSVAATTDVGPSAQAVPNTNAASLTGMDKVDYDALIELAGQAQQTTDLAEQKKLLQQFMMQSVLFLQKHPDATLLWQLRAAAAISLDDPMAGYEAGQTLIAMGAANSNDPNLQRLLTQLKNKGWLDQQGVEKAEEAKNTAAPASGTATLHVYRIRKFDAALQKPDIYIDGNKITRIKNGQTIQMLLVPGKHNIGVLGGNAKNDGPVSDLAMAAGDEYWVRADYYISANGFGRLHLKLSTVPSEQAHTESGQLEEVQVGDLSKK